MNGEVRSKSGNIDVAAYETASLSRCNGKEVGKTLKPSAPSEKKAVYKQTLIMLYTLLPTTGTKASSTLSAQR